MCIYIYNHNTSEEWRGAGRRFAESRSRLNYYQQFVSLPQQQFDEISCKLDSTDYVRSFRKYLKCFLWLTNHVLGYSWGSKPQCIKTGSLSLSTMKKNPGTQVRILVRNINASLLTLSLKAKHIYFFHDKISPPFFAVHSDQPLNVDVRLPLLVPALFTPWGSQSLTSKTQRHPFFSFCSWVPAQRFLSKSHVSKYPLYTWTHARLLVRMLTAFMLS